jgi:hypothetical protein
MSLLDGGGARWTTHNIFGTAAAFFYNSLLILIMPEGNYFLVASFSILISYFLMLFWQKSINYM